MKIKLCAFADEADSSLEGQIRALNRNNIGYIELRGVNGKNISLITEDEAKEAKRMLDEGGIRVWSVGSPIGKIAISGDLVAHLELLRHICTLANIFECKRVRMFSFYEAYEAEEKVMEMLSLMVKIADEYGVTLCHENEKGIYGDTKERILRIMSGIDGLSYVYDPANFIECGEYPSVTLDALADKMEYFHIKDALISGGIVPAGYGDGEIPKLVSKINRDTVLSIEPHLRIFTGYSEFDSTEMKELFTFSSNDEAFDAAVSAIKKVLTNAGYRECGKEFIK